MTSRFVVGLDPSLTSFGIAVVELPDEGPARIETQQLDTAGEGWLRFDYLVEKVTATAAVASTDGLVVIEGPSYASNAAKQTGHHERAGLWWAIAYQLWFKGIPSAVVSPAARAKYATGSGSTTDKTLVLVSMRERFPDVVLRGHDAADALALASMGARHLGAPLDDRFITASHLMAMSRVRWPNNRERFPLPGKAKP